jgi:hypothetical protein
MIGIRHEDKSVWEKRVPLTPEHVRMLTEEHGIRFQVQRSPTRTFDEAQYQSAGAEIVETLDECPVIIGVKEIPTEQLRPGKTYMYFSHTIKGQPANMPALKRMMELGCTLIDYERIIDEQNRRLVFFGRFAGLAGIIDTLWTLGRRLEHENISSPFSRLQPAHHYDDLDHFRRELAVVADEIRNGGLPEEICPLVCGFSGYGQVSQGAQELFDLLPVEEVQPDELHSLSAARDRCFKTVLKEEDMVRRIDRSEPFELQEYFKHPDRYEANFTRHLPYLTALVHCIYWDPNYPVMVTREQFGKLYASGQPRLRVIGDITCDIDGSIACTTHATGPGDPVYVYDPKSGKTSPGIEGTGPVVLAIDFLPCELPADASRHFSESLRSFIPGLGQFDLGGSLAESGLPAPLQRATIVYKGELTPAYQYLNKSIE